MRTCDACGVTDELPRHVTLEASGLEFSCHFHCCAALGCETCVVVDAIAELPSWPAEVR